MTLKNLLAPRSLMLGAAMLAALATAPAQAAWEPSRPVTFLIPAGTGGATSRVKKIAADRDSLVIEARRSEAETAAALVAPMDVVETESDIDSGLVDTIESRDL